MLRRTLPACCALAAFVLYVACAAPGIGFFDGGELVSAAYGLGVSHPPGQPMYSLLGKAVTLLPVGDVAFRMNVLSAAAGAAAVGLLAALALALELGISGALLAAAVLALSPLQLAQATRAEVYTPCLAATLVALVLVMAGVRARAAAPRNALVAALCLGLGAAIHPLLAAAAAVPAAALCVHALGGRRALRLLPYAVGAALLGLAAYAYLPAAASRHPALDWGGARSLENVIATASGRAYAQNFSLTPRALLQNQVTLLRLLARGASGFLVLASLPGMAWLAMRRRGGYVVAALAAFVLLATSAQSVLFAENPDVAGYLLPALAALALGVATAPVLAPRLLPHGDKAAVALALLAELPFAWRRADPPPRSVRDAESYVEDFWAAVPPRPALVLAESDHALFPLLYDQIVAGARPDAPLATPDLVTSSWYLGDLKRAHPELFVPYVDDGGRTDLLAARLIAGNLSHGVVISELYDAGGWPAARTHQRQFEWQVRERGIAFELAPMARAVAPDGPPCPALDFHGEMGRRVAAFTALVHDQYHAESRPEVDAHLYLLDAPELTPVFLFDPRERVAWDGDRAWAEGHREQGEPLLASALAEGYCQAGFALALHQLDVGDLANADATLVSTSQRVPDRAVRMYRAAGLVALAHGHGDAAQSWFGHALTLDPYDEVANVSLGNLEGQKGRYREAASYFRAALHRNADSVPALVGLGLALGRSGQTDEALASLRRALALDPSRDDVRAVLASLGRGK